MYGEGIPVGTDNYSETFEIISKNEMFNERLFAAGGSEITVAQRSDNPQDARIRSLQ